MIIRNAISYWKSISYSIITFWNDFRYDRQIMIRPIFTRYSKRNSVQQFVNLKNISVVMVHNHIFIMRN